MTYDEMHQRIVIAMLPKVMQAFDDASMDHRARKDERVVYASLAWADLVVEAYKRRDDEAARAARIKSREPK